MGFVLFEGFSVPPCRFGPEYGTMLPPPASGVSFRLKPEVDDERIRRVVSNSDGLQRWLRADACAPFGFGYAESSLRFASVHSRCASALRTTTTRYDFRVVLSAASPQRRPCRGRRRREAVQGRRCRTGFRVCRSLRAGRRECVLRTDSV